MRTCRFTKTGKIQSPIGKTRKETNHNGFCVVKREFTTCLIYYLSYRDAVFWWGGKRCKIESIIKIIVGAILESSLRLLVSLHILGYFITRWIASGHAPLSNMFEFTTAFGMLLVGAFILLFLSI